MYMMKPKQSHPDAKLGLALTSCFLTPTGVNTITIMVLDLIRYQHGQGPSASQWLHVALIHFICIDQSKRYEKSP
jgi:hypothetical protein